MYTRYLDLSYIPTNQLNQIKTISYNLHAPWHIPKTLHMRKDHRLVWSANSIFSESVLFLSFCKVPNKHRGAAFRPFFLLFPTKSLCKLIMAFSLRGHNPLNIKKSKNKLPNHGCLGIVKKQMIIDSSFHSNKTCLVKTNSSFLVDLQLEFSPKQLAKRKRYLSSGPVVLNNAWREHCNTAKNQEQLEGFNNKVTFL